MGQGNSMKKPNGLYTEIVHSFGCMGQPKHNNQMKKAQWAQSQIYCSYKSKFACNVHISRERLGQEMKHVGPTSLMDS